MKFIRNRKLHLILLTALPIVLFLIVRERISWLPRSIEPETHVFGIAFSPDNRSVTIAGYNEEMTINRNVSSRWQVTNWKIGQKKPLYEMNGKLLNPSSGMPMLLSPDAKLFAMTLSDAQVAIYEAQTGKLLHLFKPHHEFYDFVTSLAFSGDSRFLAVGEASRVIRICDMQSGTTKTLFEMKKRTPPQPMISTMVFSANGARFAIGHWDTDEGQIHFLDARRDRITKSIAWTDESLWSIALSSDGKLLADCLPENKLGVRLLDAHTGTERRRLKTPNSHPLRPPLVFSPDGKVLACRNDNRQLLLWTLASGNAKILTMLPATRRPSPEPEFDCSMTKVAFSPDSSRLAAADKGVVTIWRIQ